MNEIKNNWKVFPAGFKKILADCHDERVGIRCIDPQKNLPVLNKVFRSSNYETDNAFKDAIEQFVIQHNNEGYNVYQCVNIVNDDYNGNAVSNNDIFCLDKLFIDIDRAGDTSNPATEDELKLAWDLTCELKTFLFSRGWPKPYIVMSGNGYHLYYLLNDDMLNSDNENQQYIRQVLTYLADSFDTQKIKIDRCVHNPARITKVIGTKARKGIDSTERPYRIVRLIEDNPPPHFKFVSKEMLQRLIDPCPSPRNIPLKNWPKKTKSEASRLESPREIALLKDKLKYIDPSCSREIWVKVVFSILSTGWSNAEEIALDWSKGSPEKFILKDFERLINDYKDCKKGYGDKTITLSTAHHYAVKGGWHA